MEINKNPIANVVLNREYDIETRLGIMYIVVGLVAAVIGFVFTILSHCLIQGTLAVTLIGLFLIISIIVGFKKGNLDFVRNASSVIIIVSIPVIFVTSGGMNSGCMAWCVYELYFLALGSSGQKQGFYLFTAIILDLTLCIFDYLGYGFIYHLQPGRDMFISVVGSWSVVCAAILITVMAYKKMYNDEREYIVQQAKELERANEFEKMFLANMSHELRTPINSIIGFNEMIKRKCSDEKVLEYAVDIGTSSDHLLSLVNDILDLSKIEAGEIVLNPNTYCVTEGAQRTYDIIKSRVFDKGIDFVVDINPNIPKLMRGDKERDVQIALNLLSNAVKYTDEGRVTFVLKTEKILGDPNHVYLDIIVSDTGIGIDEANINRIFEAYRRVDGKVSGIQGTGLGLAITKTYVELMDGSISVISKEGEGSTFTARIKQEVLDWTPIGKYDVKAKQVDVSKIHKPRTFSKDAIILVVDDTSLNLKVIRSLLEDTGCEIVTVNSGERAITYVEKNPVDLILLDIMMPKMGGVETLEHIRKIRPNSKAIALTANAISGAREEYIKAGFNDYLSKPVKPEQLENIVAKYI